MKTLLVSLAILAAGLGATASSAASATTFPAGFRVKEVVTDRADSIRVGASEWSVHQAIGAPTRRLAPGVYVHYGFRADLAAANDLACRVLVITYANHKVVDMKLVNPRAATLIAANPANFRTTETLVTAK